MPCGAPASPPADVMTCKAKGGQEAFQGWKAAEGHCLGGRWVLACSRRSTMRGTGTLMGARTWPAAMPGVGRAGASQVRSTCKMTPTLESTIYHVNCLHATSWQKRMCRFTCCNCCKW